MQMGRLDGKVIVITGGARGQGAEEGRLFTREGATVILTDVLDEEGKRTAAALERAQYMHLDVRSEQEWEATVGAVVARHGRVDVLINNAGIATTTRIEDDLDTWHRTWSEVLRVNLIAAADLCREAIPHFAEKGGGIIVNVASRAAFRGDQPEMMHYAASKAGLVALTRSIARGYGKQNVVAFAVAPGFVLTEMAEQAIRDHGSEFVRKDIALPDMTGPADVANVVAFLASGLARHATGSVVDVNGASYVR